MDFLTVIGILGIGQGLFIVTYLIYSKLGHKRSSVLLACALLMITYTLTHHIFIHSRLILKTSFLIGTGASFLFALGPTIYLYIKSITRVNKPLKWWEILHYIPFFWLLIRNLPYYISPGSEKIAFMNQAYKNLDYSKDLPDASISFTRIIESFLSNQLQPLIYLGLSLWLLKQFRERTMNRSSDVQLVNPGQVTFILWGFVVTFLLGYAANLYAHYFHETEFYWSVLATTTTAQVFMVSFLGMKQPLHLTRTIEKPYAQSTLENAKSTQYLEQLLNYMEKEQPYHSPKLKLSELAERTEIPKHYLSQVINEQLNQNFYDFINSYRLKEAKDLLLKPESRKYTIIGIASEVGFNSKDAFYRTFKKQLGMTPSEYKAQKLS